MRTLLAGGLVDDLVLTIEPITLGGGKRLFPEDGETRQLALESAVTSGTGVVCRYPPRQVGRAAAGGGWSPPSGRPRG